MARKQSTEQKSNEVESPELDNNQTTSSISGSNPLLTMPLARDIFNCCCGRGCLGVGNRRKHMLTNRKRNILGRRLEPTLSLKAHDASTPTFPLLVWLFLMVLVHGCRPHAPEYRARWYTARLRNYHVGSPKYSGNLRSNLQWLHPQLCSPTGTVPWHYRTPMTTSRRTLDLAGPRD